MVLDPEEGLVAHAGEGDPGEAKELGGLAGGRQGVMGEEPRGSTVAEAEPIVAGRGGEDGLRRGVEDARHTAREALLELKLTLLRDEGGGVDGDGKCVGKGCAGLFDPGTVDGVLLCAGLLGNGGDPAADKEQKSEEREPAVHPGSIHRASDYGAAA